MGTTFRIAAIVLVVFFLPAVIAQDVEDATVAAPGAHSVEFENEHVRVISALAAPGHKSPMHSHPPLVVISLSTARVKMQNPDGSEAYLNVRPGSVFWSDSTAHSWEVVSGEVNVIAVEVKAANTDTGADQD